MAWLNLPLQNPAFSAFIPATKSQEYCIDLSNLFLKVWWNTLHFPPSAPFPLYSAIQPVLGYSELILFATDFPKLLTVPAFICKGYHLFVCSQASYDDGPVLISPNNSVTFCLTPFQIEKEDEVFLGLVLDFPEKPYFQLHKMLGNSYLSFKDSRGSYRGSLLKYLLWRDVFLRSNQRVYFEGAVRNG